MAILIGRKKEQKILQRAYQSNQSEFVVVYGRRRVGKTMLIRKTFANQFAFDMTGIANADTLQQLENFHAKYKKLTGEKDLVRPENWFFAFQRLTTYLETKEEERLVIFIDELPWFDTPNSDFVQALEHFWNSWAATREDVVLIACGSAASWMVNELMNSYGGLHNRITKRIRVEPFDLKKAEILLKIKNPQITRYQVVQLYMVMGGIPFYLEAVEPGLSATQNVQELCFSMNGLLRLEFTNLFNALFKGANRHISVVRAIATKVKGLTRSDILQATSLTNGGTLTEILDDLEKSGFIRTYIPFGKKKRDSLYQLVDFYTLFYLRFIEQSSPYDDDYWINALESSTYRAWSGYAYEQVCLLHTSHIKKALGIAGIQSRAYGWRSNASQNKVQIDLLIDRRDQVINLCEVKFTNQLFAIKKSYADNLRRKVAVFQSETNTRKAIHLTMITTYGMVDNTYLHSLVQQDLTMDIFFE